MNSGIAALIQSLKDSIRQTAEKAGRKPEEIGLVLVSKTVSVDRIREAFETGHRDFGENRVQDLADKFQALPSDIRWHMIGHLQTNKVKQVLGKTVLIHSLDRPELAEVLEKQAEARGLNQVDCLIQVNSSGETSKFGLPLEKTADFVNGLKLMRVRIRGLMTIGPLTDDEKQIRQAFRRTRELRDDLRAQFKSHSWDILSMGMSGDYKIAIEEGSTLLRVGSAVFGARK